ncbi:MAG: YegS/Rv2252/BmrU family lipid kinase [Cytophagales bacterium]|nr:YegS/Rv2252/BmrU family lipid kinase [Cytophaga sp.]
MSADSEIQYLFIINPVSGTAKKQNIPDLIYRTLKADRNSIKIVLTQYAGHGRELAAEAVLQGIPNVISVGGDGTMNEIASALLHSETALGIIPMGSGNGLARHLKIPIHPERAIRMLNTAAIRVIDSGNINEMPFFCTAGIGLDAHVGKAFNELPSRGFKTYALALIQKIKEFKGEDLRIQIDDTIEIKGTFLLTTFANSNQYGNNAFIAPDAVLDDQKLNLVLMKQVSIWKAVSKTVKLFTGKLNADTDTHQLFFKSLQIIRENEGPAHIDGEPVPLGKTIEVKTIAAALKVLTPSV